MMAKERERDNKDKTEMQQDDADMQVEVCSALLNNKRELGERSNWSWSQEYR